MIIKWIYGAVIGCLILISGLLYVNDADESDVSIEVQETVPASAMEEEITKVVVYVTGEVVHPDIYEVPEHSRLYEVIEAAGGFLPEASEDALNLARFVFDGEQIYVPKIAEAHINERDGLGMDSRVSINQADVEALMTLTGIGSTKAKAIVEYRKINGPFQRIEDIMKVNG